MYEQLTKYISIFENDDIGSIETTIYPQTIAFSKNVNTFINEVKHFSNNNKQLHLQDYKKILSKEFEGSQIYIDDIDVSRLNEKTICALLCYAVNLPKINQSHKLYDLLNNGTINSWLETLNKIDN